MKFTPGTRVKRAPGAESSRLGEDFIVLDAEGKMLRGLNVTAAWLWENLETETGVENLVKAFSSECGISLSRARNDVSRFFEKLAEKNLIEVSLGESK